MGENKKTVDELLDEWAQEQAQDLLQWLKQSHPMWNIIDWAVIKPDAGVPMIHTQLLVLVDLPDDEHHPSDPARRAYTFSWLGISSHPIGQEAYHVFAAALRAQSGQK